MGERTWPILALLVVGCSDPGGGGSNPDATVPIMYQALNAATFSMSMKSGAAQISLTDGTGTAACQLSVDHTRSLGTAGAQIILRLPDPVTDTCPVGTYGLRMKCDLSLGSEAFVPAGCAFYRRWDASGTALGIASALNGSVMIGGSALSCTVRVSIGFLGDTYTDTFNLTNGTGQQPWCL